MTIRQKDGRLSPHAPDHSTGSILEWCVLHEDEGQSAEKGVRSPRERARVPTHSGTSPPASARVRRRVVCVELLLAVTVVVTLVGLWRMGERGARALEDEVRLAVAADPLLTRRSQQPLRAARHLGPTHAQALLSTAEAREIRFHDDLGLVQVVTSQHYADGTVSVFRQEQIYRPVQNSWVHVPAAAVDWGPRQTLETAALRYYFLEQDRAAVIELVRYDPNLDEVYARLRADYGLPPAPDKVTVEVHRSIGPSTFAYCDAQPNRICVISPALVPLPVDMTDAEALHLWVLDAMLHALRHESQQTAPLLDNWSSAVNALYRVQMRHYDQRMASLHEGLVQGIRAAALDDALSANIGLLSTELNRLCCRHNAQLPQAKYLASIHYCTARSTKATLILLRHGYPDHLDSLRMPSVETASGIDMWFADQPFETVFEYVLSAYGSDTLPAMIDGFRRYDTWDELIPGVFSVSKEEFEAGWQRYLVEEYGGASTGDGDESGVPPL